MKKSPSANGGQGLKGLSAPSKQTNKCTKASSPSTKRRRPQRSTTRRSSPRAGRREVAVYDGTTLVGTIKIAADGTSTAYSARGKRLGLFSSFLMASAAFNEPTESGGAA
jgi:hypothetical protein